MKKHVIALLSVVFFLAYGSWCFLAKKETPEASDNSVEVFLRDDIHTMEKYREVHEVETASLHEVKTEADLIALAEKWKRDGVSDEMVRNLYPRINPGIASPSSGLPKEKNLITTQHDLSIIPGEYAWLLEQILDLQLPPVTASITQRRLGKLLDPVFHREGVVFTLPLTEEHPEKTVDISRLSRAEKLKLAANPAASAATLEKLARTRDTDILMAVAQNKSTPDTILETLEGTHFQPRFPLKNIPVAVRKTARQQIEARPIDRIDSPLLVRAKKNSTKKIRSTPPVGKNALLSGSASAFTSKTLGEPLTSKSLEIFQRDGLNNRKSNLYDRLRFAEEPCWKWSTVKSDEELIAIAKEWKREGIQVGTLQNNLIDILVSKDKEPDLGLPKTQLPKTVPFKNTAIKTPHDLNWERGKCAWLLEQFLECNLPPVTGTTSKEDLIALQDAVEERIKDVYNLPLVEEDLQKSVETSRLSQAEKIQIAHAPDTSAATLDKLARETDPVVLLAVAQNPRTAAFTLQHLRNMASGPDDPIEQAVAKHPKMLFPPKDADGPLFLREKTSAEEQATPERKSSWLRNQYNLLIPCDAWTSVTLANQLSSKTLELILPDTATSTDAFYKIRWNEFGDFGAVKTEAELKALVESWKVRGVSVKTFREILMRVGGGWGSPDQIPRRRKVEIITHHDISIAPGMAAWIFEQLLDCELPPVTKFNSDAEGNALRTVLSKCVEASCKQQWADMDPKKMVDVSRLSKEEKLKLAREATTSAVTLDKLAGDKDEDVCLAVVQNPHTSCITLTRLKQRPPSRQSGAITEQLETALESCRNLYWGNDITEMYFLRKKSSVK